ncbi:hypothetical protein SAMN05421858_5116 [Haladaptatus litoreus]|uniref:Uncharacterized protein n=1 Tax=Haladaptatus litoreus TaxID=553468 RepID=A0A1N7FIZ8_9EURY|nr:hypothetical protein [Haladaptatus litoreus]SIS00319.1 hypothetical protein SAMN05421858_5116 [Haladaptatus litoreus]
MPAWNDSAIIADSQALTAGQTVTAAVRDYHSPAICVALEDLGGNADDTLSVEIVGDAGTYEVDSRTLSATGSYVVNVPQAPTVQITSANGTTISAEARNNPR